MSGVGRDDGRELAAALAAVRHADPGVADAQVEEFRARIIGFVEAHPDALHRSCLRGHLTASAVVFDAAEDRVLLMHHAKLRRWLQPGGHVDGQGDLAAAARREATEETGIEGLEVVEPAVDLDIHRIPARGDEPAHDHLDVRFVVRAPHDAVVVPNHESTELRWFSIADLDGLDVDPGLVRMVRAARRRLIAR